MQSWFRAERHEYLGAEAVDDVTTRHLVRRGRFGVHRTSIDDALPSHADASTGFAPHGSVIETGGPRYPFDLLERDRVAPPERRSLASRADSSPLGS